MIPTKNLLLRAWAHNYLANAATASPSAAARRAAIRRSSAALCAAPQNGGQPERSPSRTKSGPLNWRRRLGQFDTAIARLTSIQDQVRPLSNNYLVQMFYSTLGEVQLRSHHAAEAEQAFRPALRLAEQSLASLTSEADRTSWSKDAAPVYLGLVEAELVQGREQESLDVFEWYLGAPQRVGTRGRATSKTTPEPRNRCPIRHGCPLVFLFFPTRRY